MSTALATVSNMSDAPLHSEFPFRANVSSLRALSISKHQFQMIFTSREGRGSTRYREITRVFHCLSTEVQGLFAGTSVALHD